MNLSAFLWSVADLLRGPYKPHEYGQGTIFEELIRKFAEQSSETAGDHFTPREVIRLMVNLPFAEDDDALFAPGVRTIYDPTAGAGVMLSMGGEWLLEHNPGARLSVFGQDHNDESYAICKADMLIKARTSRTSSPATPSQTARACCSFAISASMVARMSLIMHSG